MRRKTSMLNYEWANFAVSGDVLHAGIFHRVLTNNALKKG